MSYKMDNLTPSQRRKTMQHIRSKHTKPEKIIARALRKKKIYFSQHLKSINGKPDFVFLKKRVAVFIDSDFWHCNPKHFVMPRTNKKYWKNKITNNVKRDKLVNKLLKKEGWKVVRIWEHEVMKSPDISVNKILKAISM